MGVFLNFWSDHIGVCVSAAFGFFWRSGIYRSQMRYADMATFQNIFFGVLIGTAVMGAIAFFTFGFGTGGLGRIFITLEAFFLTAFTIGGRLLRRKVLEYRQQKGGTPVIIYGAGVLGEVTYRGLAATGYRVVGFVTTMPRKKATLFMGKVF